MYGESSGILMEFLEKDQHSKKISKNKSLDKMPYALPENFRSL
jgi:hypothetical protein